MKKTARGQDLYKPRPIALRTGLDRKVIERVLEEEGIRAALDSPLRATATRASKLAAYLSSIEERVRKDLTTSRILRERSPSGWRAPSGA
jgi:hypothetical protein